MKNLFLILVVSTFIFVACNNECMPQKALTVATDATKVKYQCPMLCQGDTAYTTEGICPICEMDLKEVK